MDETEAPQPPQNEGEGPKEDDQAPKGSETSEATETREASEPSEGSETPGEEGSRAANATGSHVHAPKDWRERFLGAMSKMPNVRAACEIAMVSRGHAYRVRAEDEEFAREWDEAREEGLDRIEQAVFKAGVIGDERITRTFHKDGSVATERIERVTDHRDRALLLRAYRPATFRERYDVDHHLHGGETEKEIRAIAAELGKMARQGLTAGRPILEAEVVEKKDASGE